MKILDIKCSVNDEHIFLLINNDIYFFVNSNWKFKISFIYDIEKEVLPLEEESLAINKI